MLVSRMRKPPYHAVPHFGPAQNSAGSLDMRLNQYGIGKLPPPEESERQWQLFKKLCTVAHEDQEAVWRYWQILGYTKRDLAKLQVYLRRKRLYGN